MLQCILNVAQRGNTVMAIIAWKDMQVGQTVRFVRYVEVDGIFIGDHWGYVPGELYTVIEDEDGDVGPGFGEPDTADFYTATGDHGFQFELVS